MLKRLAWGVCGVLAWVFGGLALHHHADAAEAQAKALAEAGSPWAPWAITYAADDSVETFEPFKLLVLDAETHPPLEPLSSRGKLLLGYISLGEAEHQRPYYGRLDKAGLLLDENPNWRGSRYIDVRDPRWTAMVVEELIPALIRQGFQGVFLDTLDSTLFLENEADPVRYKGMIEAAGQLVRTIRLNYPDITIMVNRAFALLPQIENDVDMVMAESLRSDYDFASKTYRMTSASDYDTILGLIRAARARKPQLTIMALDYWQPDDPATIRKLYAIERANGFLPYVSTVTLDRMFREPPP